MARRLDLDHRRGHHHQGERLQPLHLREVRGETMSVDTPAGDEHAAVAVRTENSYTFISEKNRDGLAAAKQLAC